MEKILPILFLLIYFLSLFLKKKSKKPAKPSEKTSGLRKLLVDLREQIQKEIALEKSRNDALPPDEKKRESLFSWAMLDETEARRQKDLKAQSRRDAPFKPSEPIESDVPPDDFRSAPLPSNAVDRKDSAARTQPKTMTEAPASEIVHPELIPAPPSPPHAIPGTKASPYALRSRKELRKAIVWAEILGTPVSLRKSFK